MTTAEVLQWLSTPLLRNPPLKAVEIAHHIAEAGQLVLVCLMQKRDHIKIWLENLSDQRSYHYPGAISEDKEMSRWVIDVHPTHSLYWLLLADKPVRIIEFWFSEKPVDNRHPADPISYLIVKSVR